MACCFGCRDICLHIHGPTMDHACFLSFTSVLGIAVWGPGGEGYSVQYRVRQGVHTEITFPRHTYSCTRLMYRTV